MMGISRGADADQTKKGTPTNGPDGFFSFCPPPPPFLRRCAVCTRATKSSRCRRRGWRGAGERRRCCWRTGRHSC
ncbi:hypothetical protein [Pandoravirus japonicus]|uniref:Uncharacterized protein n=1 Tax=Pandoravirus japonicus TaxID=2823154 RepID=A0A811BQX1_9VIRU|nr:hypothetical protein [Pandoravirus japonicus]